ncbi:MAG TPA: hypothetical protein VGA42_03300 [Gemmatimonadales bacterium]
MPVWLESLFEFLFKYRPLVFAKGHLAWSPGRATLLVALVLGLLALIAALGYRRVGGRVRARDRWVLLAIRCAVAAVLILALLRPTLLVSTAVPERNVVGILLDDSESMTIAEDGRTSRAATLQGLFGDPASAIPSALAERFQLRWFRFSRGAARIRAPDELRFDGTRSDLGAALDDARRDLAALPLAGLVLVSDGADNADSSVTRSLLALGAAGVPVYTVGVGQDRLPNDLELARVEAPRSALRGASVLVEALVRQQGGGGGDSAELVVEEEGRIVASRRFALPGEGQATAVRIPVALTSAGARGLTVRLPPRPGETVTRNNQREALVAVRDREERILYYEGEPRFEFAFLRRALAVDSNLRVVGLQRTAENKFLRLGVEDSLELIGGFPREREELFRYRGVILGSVEASAFTVDQLRMLTDFVSRRGGGLLFLGGSRAFSEGGFRDTPLEEVIPLDLDEPEGRGGGGGGDTTYLRDLRVQLTPAGRGHPVAQLGGTAPDAEQLWEGLPPLTSVNRVGGLKPGATALLAGTDTAGRGEQVVLATHRYGRGRAAALPVQDVWLWQMHADIPVEDQRFEAFWRQILRWITSEVPDRVMVTALSDQVAPGETIQATVEVRDPTFNGVNGGAVALRVTSPAGEVSDVPLEWAVGSDGQYRAAFPAREAGQYRVEAVAITGSDTVRSEPAFTAAGPVGREFFAAERRSSSLRRIAEETGGRYYTPETAANLANDIVYTERGITTTERLDLWDMPIVFLALAGLLAAEWSLRRARGLA